MTNHLKVYLRYCKYCGELFKTPNRYSRVCPICWSEKSPHFKTEALQKLKQLNGVTSNE